MTTYLHDYFVDGNITASAVTNDAIYMAGSILTVGLVSNLKANKGAIINTNTMTSVMDSLHFTPLGNSFTATIQQVFVVGNDVYFVGNFQAVNGINCQKIVKINSLTKEIDVTIGSKVSNDSNILGMSADNSGNLFIFGSINNYDNNGLSKPIIKVNAATGIEDPLFNHTEGLSGYTTSMVAFDNSGHYYARDVTNQLCKFNAATGEKDTNFNSLFLGPYVYDMAADSSGNLYIVGDFTNINPSYGRIIKIDTATGNRDISFSLSEELNTASRIVIDNSGFLYSNSANSIQRTNLITKTIDNNFTAGLFTNQNYQQPVSITMYLDGSGNLYVAGDFDAIGNTSRQRIAKLDAVTGALDSQFDTASGFNGTVRSIALDASGNLCAGGDFSNFKNLNNLYSTSPSLSGATIVKILKSTDEVDPTFDAGSVNDRIEDILVDGSGNVYACGNFTAHGETARGYILKLNGAGELDTNFDSEVGFDGQCFKMQLDGIGNLFVTGYFTNYNGVSRQLIAKLDATTAAIDMTFDTSTDSGSLNAEVYALTVDNLGNYLYVGGYFSDWKGVPRTHLVKLSATDASVDMTFDTEDAFNVNDDYIGWKNAILLDGAGSLFVGGYFNYYQGQSRNCLVKMSTATAAVDMTFDTSNGFDSDVEQLKLDDAGNLYVGGYFSQYKGDAAFRIAKLNGTTGELDVAFDTSTITSGGPSNMFVDNSSVYIFGEYLSDINGYQCYGNIILDKTTAAKVIAGNGSSVDGIVYVDGAVVGAVTVNPKTTAVLINGQPLPTGSTLRNTITGQKFIKINGDEFAYVAIEVVPKPEWGWSQEGIDAWAILQNY